MEAPIQGIKATNYFRLVQLTMLEGTNVVRKTILNRLRQGNTLHTILEERRSEFFQRGSGFNRQQLDVLYPATGNADLASIDMSLWFALGRKLRVLPKTYLEDLHAEESTNANNVTPLLTTTQMEWCQDLATIHAVRNNLFHLVKPVLETEAFNDQWMRLTDALFRLDPGLDPSVIERYRRAELNPKAVAELRAMILEQCFQERCEDLVDEVHKRNRILLVAALVMLLILAAVLLYVFIVRLPRLTCDKSLEFRTIGDLGVLLFQPRSGWGAVPPARQIEPLRLPVEYIVYTHTADVSACSVPDVCCNQVKNIQYQQMHIGKTLHCADIAYHYLIDSLGIVYEGRDITRISSTVYGWNRNITSVAFIGNFMYQTPTTEALAAFNLLIAYMLYNSYITRNYNIYGICEILPTSSPGRNLYDDINKSNLNQIFGYVRHRRDNHCFFYDSVEACRNSGKQQQYLEL